MKKKKKCKSEQWKWPSVSLPIANAEDVVGKWEPSYATGGSVNCCSHYGDPCEGFLQYCANSCADLRASISWRCLCIVIVHWLWSFSRSFFDSKCYLSSPTAISLHAVGRYYLPEKLFCWRKRKLTNTEDAHVGSCILPKHHLFSLKWKVVTRSFPRLLCVYLEDSYSIFKYSLSFTLLYLCENDAMWK